MTVVLYTEWQNMRSYIGVLAIVEKCNNPDVTPESVALRITSTLRMS